MVYINILSIFFVLFNLILLFSKIYKNYVYSYISIFLFYLQLCLLLLLSLSNYFFKNKFNFIFGDIFISYYNYFSFNIIGLLLIILSIFIGNICFLVILNKSSFYITYFNIIFQFFFLVIFLFSFCNNIVLFFIFYEFLLIPSFILVYWLSPNKRGIYASIYFLMWTQLGSVLVLLAIIYLLYYYNVYFFKDLYFLKLSSWEVSIISLLLFFGFGIKIPIWPFHFWLTKTHVEATTSFSIYLSGFLVKTALFGFFKFFIFFNNNPINYLYIIILSIGVIDSSLKFWVQVDLKKLVAYCTVQEMNIILLNFFFGFNINIYFVFTFILTHTILSTIFFFIVDLLYKRFNTRLTYNIKGLFKSNINLTTHIIIAVLLYNGFPISLKFIVEVLFLLNFMNINFILFIIIIFACNFFGSIGFVKVWFNVIFGDMVSKKPIFDLNLFENFILFICYVVIISPCLLYFF